MANTFSEVPSSEEREEFEEALLRLKVASRIEVLAEDTGVSRTELARRVGRSKPWISKVLSGYHNLTLDTLSRIGWALGVRWDITPHGLADRDASPAREDSELPQWVLTSARNLYAEAELPVRGLAIPGFWAREQLALYAGSYPDRNLVGGVTSGLAPLSVASGQLTSRQPTVSTSTRVAFVIVGVFEAHIPMDLSLVGDLLLDSGYATALLSGEISGASQYLSLFPASSEMEELSMEFSWVWSSSSSALLRESQSTPVMPLP
jgi:transcriptional regulator with XRE-family HTH domain